eukprot:CAMPEP_0194195000 /NCGR_PEP_ID=MMETSP0154-20130528/75888_1 /TAXON_ID=1049557 /ORGANISM="Thalassiothrix antarctica, Strain L6-D1" /LENGTH=254 /DNA_ID=CAMNT_0038919481 /DNA_START=323 /DNA_END=1087 /DNA_ORIENTATION=-
MKSSNTLFNLLVLFAAIDSVNSAIALPHIISGVIGAGRKLEGFHRSLKHAHCNSFDYEVDLLIDAHLVIALVPTNEADEAGCKPFLIHANSIDNKMHKQVIEVDTKEVLYEGLIDSEEHLLPLGHYLFDEVVHSFNKAAVDAYDHDDTFDIVENNCGDFLHSFNKAAVDAYDHDDTFDIVENNCGDFLAHFLEHLGHETNENEMEVITSGLLYANPDLANMMREKVVGTLVDELSDHNLVFSVVKQKMGKMLKE